MKGFTIRTAAIAAGIAGLALLAACSTSAPDNSADSGMNDFIETSNALDLNAVAPTPEPTVSPTPAPVPHGNDLQQTEQTFDDADAVGMTAKLPAPDASGTPVDTKKQ